MEGICAFACFELKVTKPAYRQLLRASLKNKIIAFFRGFTSDTRTFAKLDETGGLEMRFKDDTEVSSSGYQKEDVIAFLEAYMQDKTQLSVKENIKSDADKFARMINRSGIEIIETSKRTSDKKVPYYVHGADIKSKPLLDQFTTRAKIDEEATLESAMLMMISDQYGTIKDNVQLIIVNEEASSHNQTDIPMRDSEVNALEKYTERQIFKEIEKEQKKRELEKEKERKEKEKKEKAVNEAVSKLDVTKMAQACKEIATKNSGYAIKKEEPGADLDDEIKETPIAESETHENEGEVTVRRIEKVKVLDLDGINDPKSIEQEYKEAQNNIDDALKDFVGSAFRDESELKPEKESKAKDKVKDELDDELDFLPGYHPY